MQGRRRGALEVKLQQEAPEAKLQVCHHHQHRQQARYPLPCKYLHLSAPAYEHGPELELATESDSEPVASSAGHRLMICQTQ